MLLPYHPSCIGGNDAYTKILLHFDGANASTTITDYNAGGSAHTWTNHTGSIATAQSMFGGSSYNCGAAAGWVDTPDSADFTLGSGEFTIDFWMYISGGAGVIRQICGQSDSTPTATTRSASLSLNASNVLLFQTFVGSTATSVLGVNAPSVTTWHHVAAVRTGNTLRLFLDGVQEGSDSAQSGTLNNSANTFSVGRLGAYNSTKFNGYIDEFRLSVGIARWTAAFPLNDTAYG